jgi:hypothetical protein
MAGLDLSGVARAVDGWVVDEGRIWRDQGSADDVLDEETGDLTPGPAAADIYTGRMMIQALTGFDTDTDPDVATIISESGATHRMLLPAPASVEPRTGDLAQVTEQHGTTADPTLPGKTFQVVHPGRASSFYVARVIYLKDVTREQG